MFLVVAQQKLYFTSLSFFSLLLSSNRSYPPEITVTSIVEIFLWVVDYLCIVYLLNGSTKDPLDKISRVSWLCRKVFLLLKYCCHWKDFKEIYFEDRLSYKLAFEFIPNNKLDIIRTAHRSLGFSTWIPRSVQSSDDLIDWSRGFVWACNQCKHHAIL